MVTNHYILFLAVSQVNINICVTEQVCVLCLLILSSWRVVEFALRQLPSHYQTVQLARYWLEWRGGRESLCQLDDTDFGQTCIS